MNAHPNKPQLKYLPIEFLVPGQFQPRQHFDQQKLNGLAQSIRTGGLLQPLVVRSLNAAQYEIVAGERRWRAAQLAGLATVPCLVHVFSDHEALQSAIIENVNRADLNPIEESKGYQRLIDEFDYSHEDIAESVGKSRTAITNALRLLKLVPTIQTLLIEGRLTEGHGKILAGFKDADQRHLATLAVDRNWNVRKLEQEAKKYQQQGQEENHQYTDANVKQLEMALSEHIGNRVQVEYEEKGGGYLRIRFNNIDELEGQFKKFGFEKST